MITLILCAGKNERWWLPYPKQLAPIRGEPLIERTVRQCRKLDPIIVTQREELLYGSWRRYRPQMYRWIVETLLSTRPLWKGDILVLLGDVVWTYEALALVMRDVQYHQIVIYHNARLGEIFAVRFRQDAYPRVMGALQTCIDRAQLYSDRGKLWEWFAIIQQGGTSGVGAIFVNGVKDIDTMDDWMKLKDATE